MNVLFTSAGRRVALVRLFREAMRSLGMHGTLVTADRQRHAAAHFVADVRLQVPPVDSPDYVARLLGLCREHRIDLLIPLIDSELVLLAASQQEFRDRGVRVLVPSLEAVTICADKRRSAPFFRLAGVATPSLLDFDCLIKDPSTPFPLIVKPADGSSSIGVTRVRNAGELAFFRDYVPNAIVQPLVIGDEYTLDVLVDFGGRVRCVVPRWRIETRAGEISKGVTVKHSRLIDAGARVAAALPGCVGCITIQCFLTPDEGVEFLEINPRFGGGFPLSAAAGADFPRWILQWMRGEDPEIALDGWHDGVAMLRYDEAIITRRDAIE